MTATVSGPVSGTVWRSRTLGASVRVHPRAVVVTTVLLALLAAVCVVSMSTGDFPLPVFDVIKAVVGLGDPAADYIVNTLRLPRVLTAVCTGAALAVSGALMQRITRNPLGSPDIIGFTHGSSTGALIVIIALHGSMTEIALGGLIGGLAAALAVYLLALRGGVQGFRFILVGIGISAMLLAVNAYLITRASWQDGLTAQAWLIGTLNERGWDQAMPVGIVLLIALPLALFLARDLAQLELGDATATGLGVRVEWVRLALIVFSVTLAAVATASTGPITFVALAAPQLARRLTGSVAPGLLPSAAMGALLLTTGDLAVQRVFAPAIVPVGVATGSLGGLYLIWLLTAEWRQGRV